MCACVRVSTRVCAHTSVCAVSVCLRSCRYCILYRGSGLEWGEAEPSDVDDRGEGTGTGKDRGWCALCADLCPLSASYPTHWRPDWTPPRCVDVSGCGCVNVCACVHACMHVCIRVRRYYHTRTCTCKMTSKFSQSRPTGGNWNMSRVGGVDIEVSEEDEYIDYFKYHVKWSPVPWHVVEQVWCPSCLHPSTSCCRVCPLCALKP